MLKWGRARKRYKRQGLLVEEQAIEQAERECLADGEVRARRREQEAARRAELDQEYRVLILPLSTQRAQRKPNKTRRSQRPRRLQGDFFSGLLDFSTSSRFRRKPNRLLLQLDLAFQHVRDERLHVSQQRIEQQSQQAFFISSREWFAPLRVRV